MYAGGDSSAPVAPFSYTAFQQSVPSVYHLGFPPFSLLIRIYHLRPLSFAGLTWDVSKVRNLLTRYLVYNLSTPGGDGAAGTPVSSAVALPNCF
jgi:hypothetical protein